MSVPLFMPYQPFDLSRVKAFPLAERKSMARADEILVDPESVPKPLSDENASRIDDAVQCIQQARARGASVMMIYGAHLLKNGAARIIDRLIAGGWLSHLATNGAGTIHDWEFAWHGASTESVRDNVANGTFGTWDETSTNIHVALLAGALDGLGYGEALGRFMIDNGTTLPTADELSKQITSNPSDPLTAARADLLTTMQRLDLPSGRREIEHRHLAASIVASAFRNRVPLTVHPGVGYDIISNHPIFNGAAIGRAAEVDFKLFAAAVDRLDGGVVLNVGSAIMGPQVFEKTISCVNNVRLQGGKPVVSDHNLFVVDIQDGGGWDWTTGEPPMDNPAYYLRFCKSYSRMGGSMRYVQCDNVSFVHHLLHRLNA